jgi:hypothetical protein
MGEQSRREPADAGHGAGDALPRMATAPSPSGSLNVTRFIWQRGKAVHRIHQQKYAPTAFNPGVVGNARFSPIQTLLGVAIPTLYGGTTFDCAAMETVFHDVPFVPGFKSVAKQKLASQHYSVLEPREDLVLADLSQVALRKLGIARAQLIDTEKDRYPSSREWAHAIYTQCPDVQGLRWVSRQDDRAEAIMLFGDRISAGVLSHIGVSRDLLLDAATYGGLLALAGAIGVTLVEGKQPT